MKVSWKAFAAPLLAVLACEPVTGQSLSSGLGNSFSGLTNVGSAPSLVTQMAFAPRDPNHLYAATQTAGIWRYDYDPREHSRIA